MLEIKNLHKHLGGKHVLRGVNLQIEKGETLVVMGGSGCGKSVMLKHILGLMKPDEGSIEIDGKDIATMPEQELNETRMRFGMLFQSAALFDSMTVAENVSFALDEHQKLSREETRQIVAKKLAMVGLPGVEKMYPADLSGGMKKRVGLARAIATDPEFLLYDEPTTGLDPIMSDVINELILKMKRALRVTSIVVTHDMASARKVADRMAMLHEGTIRIHATPDEVYRSEDEVVKRFIHGQASESQLGEVWGENTKVRYRTKSLKPGGLSSADGSTSRAE